MQDTQIKYGLTAETVSYCRHLLRRHYLKSNNFAFWLRLSACCTPSRKNTLLSGAEPRPFPPQQRCALSFHSQHFRSALILLQACWLRTGNPQLTSPCSSGICTQAETSAMLPSLSQEEGWDKRLCWPPGTDNGQKGPFTQTRGVHRWHGAGSG